MVEAGIRAFNHPDEAYPFYDGELGDALVAVYLGMSALAHTEP
jgi:hypothetical protein